MNFNKVLKVINSRCSYKFKESGVGIIEYVQSNGNTYSYKLMDNGVITSMIFPPHFDETKILDVECEFLLYDEIGDMELNIADVIIKHINGILNYGI